MLYKRGHIWWFRIKFAGRMIRESAKTTSKALARRAELQRRRTLEEGYHRLKKPVPPQTLKSAAADWLKLKEPTLAAKSLIIEKTNLGHILDPLGQRLLTEITPDHIAHYQQLRRNEGAAPKTINLEVGTLRAILRKHRLWSDLQPDVRMLRTEDEIGKALKPEEEARLRLACSRSRSRSLMPAVVLALNTGMRYSELRLLRWSQVDLNAKTTRVGKSKTDAGRGRVIPMNNEAMKILKVWADQFPDRKQDHFVFPAERYGAGGDDFVPAVYGTDPTRPIGSWKEAWETAKKKADVSLRFHDLRHTCVTRMIEGGAPLLVVASILGWSAATTVRMAKRYGHIGQLAQREAVGWLDKFRVGLAKTSRSRVSKRSNTTHSSRTSERIERYDARTSRKTVEPVARKGHEGNSQEKTEQCGPTRRSLGTSQRPG